MFIIDLHDGFTCAHHVLVHHKGERPAMHVENFRLNVRARTPDSTSSFIASEYPANYSNKAVHTDMLHKHDSTVVGLLLQSWSGFL